MELRVDTQERASCWRRFKDPTNRAECLSSVGGRSTEKARVSWLIVSRGFGGRRVFHNDTERPCDTHETGHPALSLLIPDSSFSLDSTRLVAADEAVLLLLDQSESQASWSRTHTRTHAHTESHSLSHAHRSVLIISLNFYPYPLHKHAVM